MDQEQIKSKLVTAVGQTSLSDRTISEFVANIMPPEGVEPDEDFFTKNANILRSLGGNFSHDVAAQVDEFKKTYKPAQPTQQQGQQTQQQQQQQNDQDALIQELKRRLEAIEGSQQSQQTQQQQQQQSNPALEALQGQIQKLLDLESSRQNKAAVDNLISSLDGLVSASKLVINDKPTWDLAIDMVKQNVKTDTTGAQLLEMVKTEYNTLFKRLNPSTDRQAFGTTEPGQHKSFAQAFIERRENEEKARREYHKEFLSTLK